MCSNKYYYLLKKKLITLKPITHTMLPTPLSQIIIPTPHPKYQMDEKQYISCVCVKKI